jgi:hypothetical protein
VVPAIFAKLAPRAVCATRPDIVTSAATGAGAGTAAGTTGALGDDTVPAPPLLTATTVNVYGTPLLRPLIVQDVPNVVHERPPGTAVATYELTTVPAGAVQDTSAEPTAGTATTPVGAPGAAGVVGARGVTGAAAHSPEPTAFVARTDAVYVVSWSRPVTVQVVVVVVQLAPPGIVTTEYPVTGLPPVEAGGDHTTVIDLAPAAAVGEAGAPGTVAGVTGADAADATDVPAAFVAVAVNAYEVPSVRPVIVHVVVGAATVQPAGPAGATVTEYEVTALPLSAADAVHDTTAVPEPTAAPPDRPATAVTDVGSAGGAIGAAGLLGDDATDVPTAFVAVAVNE